MNFHLFIVKLFVCIFLLARQVWAQHDHGEEDPFHEIVELAGGNGESLSSDQLQDFLHTLGDRLPESKQCFTVEKLGEILKTDYGSTDAQIQEEDFHNISTVLLYIATEKSCEVQDVQTAKEHLWSQPSTMEENVEGILEKLHSVDYEEDHDTHSCFNAFLLHHDDESAEAEEVFAKIILNLFKGLCILPEVEYFRDEFLEYLNATDNTISKEAFHNLMMKIGIGEESHDEDEADSHDGHDHRRRKRDSHDHDDEHEHSTRCYTSEEMFAIFGVENNMTFEKVTEMCPALLHQLTSGACLHVSEENATGANNTTNNYTQAKIFGYGTAAVAIISALALVGIIFFPVLETQRYKLAMQFLVALGVSTMASDALLHIIPYILGIHLHSDDAHEHEENEDKTFIWRMTVVCAGIYFFYFFENSLGLWNRHRKGSSNVAVHSHEVYHDHSHNHNGSKLTDFTVSKPEENGSMGKSDLTVSEEMLPQAEVICFGLNTICIMVLIGDVLHNFADGIAIGVSFGSSWSQGVGSSIAIFCHELPHEFGDFAIYLRNGASKWKAVLLNFSAACCSFIGLYLGITVAQDDETRQWLMAAIAGMFLYISLVEVMHEMLADITNRPYLQFFLQNFGLLLGFVILLLIALYEDKLDQAITG